MFWKLASSVSAEYDSAPAVIRGMPVHTVAGEEETASKSRKSEVIESHRVCIFTQAGKRKDPWPQDISFKFVTAFLPALSMCQSSFRQSLLLSWGTSSSHNPAMCFFLDIVSLSCHHCKFTVSICAFLPLFVLSPGLISHPMATYCSWLLFIILLCPFPLKSILGATSLSQILPYPLPSLNVSDLPI